MIPDFPSYATLLFQDNSFSPTLQNRRSQFEAGYVRQAPIHCRRMIQTQVTYALCSSADASQFTKWIDQELKSGSQWFLWTHPMRSNADGEVVKLRARILGGLYTLTAKARSFEQYHCNFTIEYYSDGGV
jgi:hypothetical protein